MANEERNIEALHIHIEGLQGTLTKRNKRIEELEKQVVELRNSPFTLIDKKKAYTEGWKACAYALTDATHKMALDLKKIQKEAWKVYNAPERSEQ